MYLLCFGCSCSFTIHGNKETKKISEIVEIQAGGYLCINEKEDLICAVAALIFHYTDFMPLGAELVLKYNVLLRDS